MYTSSKGKSGTHHNEFPKIAKKLKLNYVVGAKNSTFKELNQAIKKNYTVIICYFDKRLQEGHYAVVKKIDKRRIYLLDPTSGPNESYSRAHFRKIWHGYYTYNGWFFGIK
jgi:ABC-type bacteriocin/lantibiotic exporter with double-glycine peptidase domain